MYRFRRLQQIIVSKGITLKEHILECVYSLNWKYFFLLLVLFAISIDFIRFSPNQQLDLDFKNGQPRKHVFKQLSPGQLALILSEALGSTLHLSWYDICFDNKSEVIKLGSTVEPVILGVSMFPLSTNKALLDFQKGLEIFPDTLNEGSGVIEREITGQAIIAFPNTQRCLPIQSSEGGFEYALFYLIKTKDQYSGDILVPVSVSNINAIDSYPLDVGPVADSRQLHLKASTLSIQTNFYALWIKRFIFILLFLKVIESIEHIRKKLMGKIL